MDCLFVHVPKFKNYYRPIGEYTFINYLPMGVLALADLLARGGYETEVLHLGVEWIEDKGFSLIDYIAQKRPRVVALSLHWHPQSYEVLEQARMIKEAFPEISIILGGLTASFFHREIMERFPWVDAIIRGEGEVPLLQVMEAIIKGGVLQTVPNLTWRQGKKVCENPLAYCASQEILDGLVLAKGEDMRRYPLEERIAMYRPAMNRLKKVCGVALCEETPEAWDALGLDKEAKRCNCAL